MANLDSDAKYSDAGDTLLPSMFNLSCVWYT